MGINNYNINGFLVSVAIAFLFLLDNGYCAEKAEKKVTNTTTNTNKTIDKPQLRQPTLEPVLNLINDFQKLIFNPFMITPQQSYPQHNNQNSDKVSLEQLTTIMQNIQGLLEKSQNKTDGTSKGNDKNNNAAANYPKGQSPLEQIYGILGNIQKLFFYPNGGYNNNSPYQSIAQSLIQQIFILMTHFQNFLINSNCIPNDKNNFNNNQPRKSMRSSEEQPFNMFDSLDEMIHEAEYSLHNNPMEGFNIPGHEQDGYIYNDDDSVQKKFKTIDHFAD